jgi:hypothetical protein
MILLIKKLLNRLNNIFHNIIRLRLAIFDHFMIFSIDKNLYDLL